MRHMGPLCENVTSSTKPEVHSVSQRRQRRTEARPQATTEKMVKLEVWFSSFASGGSGTDIQINRQTGKQTYSSQYFAPLPPGAK